MVDLDRTEREIIQLLQEDGRMSFVDLAKAVGVTEGTIRRKFNRLTGEGIIRIAAVADPFSVGFESPAIISLKVEPSALDEVIEKVVALPEIRYVALCTGQHDLVCEGYFASNQDLSRFLVEKLAKIDGIREITTSLILRIAKQSFTWGVASQPRIERRRALAQNE